MKLHNLGFLLLLLPAVAVAQDNILDGVGGVAAGGACVCVSDPPVETSTSKIANSLTIGGGAGRYVDQSDFLTAQNQQLTSDIRSAADFNQLFPGWVDYADPQFLLAAGLPDANAFAAKQADTILRIYANVMNIALNQAAHFTAESAGFNKAEQCSGAEGVTLLQAIQCGNEIGLIQAQQAQLQRQLQIAQMFFDSVDRGWNVSTLAQIGAHEHSVLQHAADGIPQQ